MILTIYQFLIEMLPFVPFDDDPQGMAAVAATTAGVRPEAVETQTTERPPRASSGYG